MFPLLIILRPKLKLSLFDFTDRHENIPPTQKILLEKSIVVFLLVTTVHRITFDSIYPETIAEKL